MRFFDIDGNEKLKKNISDTFSLGHIPHAITVSGGTADSRMALARSIAAFVQCGEADAPCMKCVSCKKVTQDIHPDVEIITTDKQTMGVDMARDVCAEAYVRPNEGARHIFILQEAHRLTPAAQNALLKTLEEPPGTAMFILTLESAGSLLVTVRSRCVDYHLQSADRTGPVPENSREFIALLSRRDALLIAEYTRRLEKHKREEFAEFLAGCSTLVARELREQYLSEKKPKLTSGELVRLADVFEKATKNNDNNCGVGHTCGLLSALCWEALN